MGVRRDVFYANWLCNKRNVLNREKIYFETNEDLDKIFKDIDFSDKDVLSVLASSDQLFKLNSLDTKSIETFDKNKLTYYYYYFRVWTIKYMKKLYPTALIIGDDYWIDTLLSLVNPETEEEKQQIVECGCDVIQGFLYDRPLPIAQFEEKYIVPEREIG